MLNGASRSIVTEGTLQNSAPIWSVGFNLTAGVGFTANWTVGPITLNLTYQDNLVNATATLAHAVEVDTGTSKYPVPPATVGGPYYLSLQASGGSTPYTWAYQPGSHPPSWLSLSPGGVLSGTPPSSVANTTVSVPVQVTDSSTPQITATAKLSVQVDDTGVKAGGLTWSVPTYVDTGSSDLFSVSCTSVSFCMAVDWLGNALSFDGSGWSTPTVIDPSATSGNFGVTPPFVSCPSTTACVAVDGAGKAIVYSNGTWGAPVSVDSKGFSSLSCPTTSFCAAVDNGGNALTYSNGAWSPPVSVDSTPNGTSGGGGSISALSCASSTFCEAVTSSGGAYHFDGTSWSAAVEVDPAGSLATALDALSCVPGGSTCVAGNSNGQLFMFDGVSWSTPFDVFPTHSIVWSLSCPTASFCVATDQAGDESSLLNGTWSTPVNLNTGGSGGYGGNFSEPTVSCASTRFCAATNVYGNASEGVG